MGEQIFFRQNSLFVEVLTILQKNVLKASKRITENLLRLVIWTNDGLNIHLANALDEDM